MAEKTKAALLEGSDVEGLPLAMAPLPSWILGSSTLLEQWRNRNSPDDVEAMDFNCDDNSLNVCGRLVQVLVVIHSGAPASEWDNYLPACF